MINSSRSTNFYEYLFKNQEYPFKNKGFRFLIIDFDEDQNKSSIINFLEDLINDSILLQIEDNFILFYFEDLEIEVKDLFSSIGDDFSINLRVFTSSKIDQNKPENFMILFSAFKKYLKNKPYTYANNSNLILEIIRQNFSDLKNIKSAVLNKISEDSQIEKLIFSMFENNLNVTQTANDVYMHRNTIINKLEFIKQETGLNLQNFKDAACIYWLMGSK